jgi:hypothetical protein
MIIQNIWGLADVVLTKQLDCKDPKAQEVYKEKKVLRVRLDPKDLKVMMVYHIIPDRLDNVVHKEKLVLWD